MKMRSHVPARDLLQHYFSFHEPFQTYLFQQRLFMATSKYTKILIIPRAVESVERFHPAAMSYLPASSHLFLALKSLL